LNIGIFLYKYFPILVFKNHLKYWRSFIFIFKLNIYFDNTIDNYDKYMLVYTSLKPRASLQSTTFYVISENFSFLHYKLFENIQIFWTKGHGSKSVYFQRIASFGRYTDLLPHPVAQSTNNIHYSIRTIWLRRIIFNIRFGLK